MPYPIRVLLIAPSLDILGGQAVQAMRLRTNLKPEKSIEMGFLPINPRLPGWIKQIKYFRTLAGWVTYVCTLLCHVWRYEIVHIFSAGYSSYTLWTIPALLVSKLYGKKVILNYRDGQAEDHLRNWRTAIPTVNLADVIVAPSGFLVDVFAQFGLKARSIFNNIDVTRFRYRERRKLKPVFMTNRILEPLYNIGCLMRAFQIVQQRYPDASLTIAHDGPSRAELEQLAVDLGLRNTRFIGRVPHEKVAELYDSAEIYLTSPDIDCMPGSLLECYASGLPIVATKAGGIPYISTNEKTALLVPIGDYTAMAECVFRLLEDEELVARLTEGGRRELEKYSWSSVRDRWLGLYRELAGNP